MDTDKTPNIQMTIEAINCLFLKAHVAIVFAKVVHVEEAHAEGSLALFHCLSLFEYALDVISRQAIIECILRVRLELILKVVGSCRSMLLLYRHFFVDRLVKHAFAIECHQISRK